MTIEDTCLAVIPFSGLYYSVHSDALDREMEHLMADDSGCRPISAKLADMFQCEASYSDGMLEAYAKAYLEGWSAASSIPCELAKVDSPKFYNFETDRIFAHVPIATLHQLYDGLDKTRMMLIAAKRHTSRSGFISFYSPDWRTWGEVEEWEPEQLHTLILASLSEDMPKEYELADTGNGEVSEAVYSGLSDKAKRLVRIADYLRDRASRKWRTRK